MARSSLYILVALLFCSMVSFSGVVSAALYLGDAWGRDMNEPLLPIKSGFDADPISGAVPLRVMFMDSSVGTPEKYFWDFGDGSSSTTKSPEHTFTSPGTFDVALTVTGTSGETDTAMETITVTGEDLRVNAGFSYGPADTDPLVIRFSDQSTGEPDSFAWDFGNGGYSSDRNPVISFPQPGSYTVSLTVTGKTGTDTRSEDILVGSDIRKPDIKDSIPEKMPDSTSKGTTHPPGESGKDPDTGDSADEPEYKDGESAEKPSQTELFKAAFQDRYVTYVNDFELIFSLNASDSAQGTISGHGSIEGDNGISTIDVTGPLTGSYDPSTGSVILSGHTSAQWVPPPKYPSPIETDWSFEGKRSGDIWTGIFSISNEGDNECPVTNRPLTAVKVSSPEDTVNHVVFEYSGKGCEWINKGESTADSS